MSSSLPGNIPVVLEYIAKNIFSKLDLSEKALSGILEGQPLPAPAFRILDVGAGYGKWGFLIRDTFEVMSFQRFRKEEWKIHLTAVEPFGRCITPLQEAIYNTIIRNDLFGCIDDLGRYDLVLLGDVIEHFEKEDGFRALDKLFEHTGDIILSTPLGFMPQEAWAGNEREIHRSGWTPDDLERYHIVEQRVVEDHLFRNILEWLPGTAAEHHEPVHLLIAWIRKKEHTDD